MEDVSISTGLFLFLQKERIKGKKKKQLVISYLCHKYTGENINAFPVRGIKKPLNTPVYFDELC